MAVAMGPSWIAAGRLGIAEGLELFLDAKEQF
jgi:hypothetical protein